MQAGDTQRKNRRTTLLLGGMVVLMFGFGFALVPLYNLFCQVTGTQSIALRAEMGRIPMTSTEVDEARLITVKFDTTVNPNLPWEFEAAKASMQVHPGQMYEVNFVANNRSSATVTGQAIPSVAPWQATPYFSKLECFCFNRQTLEGHEQTDMPLRFMVSPDLPAEIHSLTLSYSFMRLKAGQEPESPTAIPPAIVTAQ
ncbi:MAG: cytochrome c oxidase assembly protein [Gammaproteobacteria bacterium]|nr:cytochrome c oxidase assembly protein [Gammaproteobacteria bacterium]